MKNEMIIASWDRILPDKAADERMRTRILEYQRSRQSKDQATNRKTTMMKVVPIAACMILFIAVGTFIGTWNHWLGAKQYIVSLNHGETLVYGKGSPKGAASYAYEYEVKDRVLSAEELHMLFPTMANIEENGLPYCTFKADTGELLRLEMIVDDIHIHIARSGLPVTDTMIVGEESVADIEGIAVKTGYFVTDANSKGIRTAIFFAEYEKNDATIYFEVAGNEKDSQQLSEKLSAMLLEMIYSKAPDISAINF